MSFDNLKFGIFLAPFHTNRENPTITLQTSIVWPAMPGLLAITINLWVRLAKPS